LLAAAVSLVAPFGFSGCASDRKTAEPASRAAAPIPILQFAAVAEPDETVDVVEFERGGGMVRVRPPRTYEIKDASPAHDAFGYPALQFEIADSQKAEFRTWTASLVDHQMAIILDGRILTMPRVLSALNGSGIVENPEHWTDEEVRAIAARIRSEAHARRK
jgi:preprotein translocase subunit SecD